MGLIWVVVTFILLATDAPWYWAFWYCIMGVGRRR